MRKRGVLWGWMSWGVCLGCTIVPPTDLGDEWSPPSETWRLIWSDEFDGPPGSSPDGSRWTRVTKGCNFNEELQFYTDRTQNVVIDEAGHLVIVAAREDYEGHPFTSGRLESYGAFEQRYGAFEARIQLPAGKGIWPAFWLLGNDIQTVSWPESGEVDILELRGSRPGVVSGTLHTPGHCGGGGTEVCPSSPISRDYQLPGGASFDQDFHVFRFEWLDTGLRWLVDGEVFHSRSRENLERLGVRWVFDHPFFIILNIAVGGVYDGNPGAATVFPQRMRVDYVRVYDLPETGAETRTGPPAVSRPGTEFDHLGVAPVCNAPETSPGSPDAG